MQEKSSRHLAALRFAEAGIPVFPCLPNTKFPATEHGFLDASTDPNQIDAWWSAADYNLAFSPASVGWGIVDIDGELGEKNWNALLEEHGSTETYTVTTPSGGRHLYYEGSVRPTTGKLAEKIDTRGVGSYALLPPSVINGKSYVVSDDRELAPMPEWVVTALGASPQKVAAANHDLDNPGNIERAVSYLKDLAGRGEVAIEGRGGNARTYILACDIINLGLSNEKAQELIEEHWNPHCIPPWESEELARIVANASNYAQNEVGAWATAPAAETFKAALDQLDLDTPQPERRSRFYFKDIDEQDETAEAKWMIPELIPDQSTVLVLAESGHFKSFLTQDWLLSIAAGHDVLGVKPQRRGPVFYGAHEGRNALQKDRKAAWLLGHDVEREEVRGFYVAPGPLVAFPEQCEDFREQIRVRLREPGQRKIAGIVLDTVAKSMAGLDENKAQDAGVFVQFCDSLRDEFECPVIALHHLGKDGNSHGRGSSALVAGFDTIINIKRIPDTTAVEVRVLQHKDAEERIKPWTLEGRKVGPSLVFYETTEAAHRAITNAGDIFEPRKIGHALAQLDAYGFEKAVTTAVLAGELIAKDEALSPEELLQAQNRAARSLAALSKKSLEAYCQKVSGRELAWFLPAKA